ncbi:hypothetical protein F441_03427 [Phytophthora nicotianae CJ01A1]|nr:hypothetical protein F443_03444 [Phytophthora nicotianae P1569]ETM00041.1 hypothetical protein L917_03203 [Phytophthora nicotianae]ETP23440.1 hypothetical protein F441_03427 [Phytophthora nicotianae CJ01A1]
MPTPSSLLESCDSWLRTLPLLSTTWNASENLGNYNGRWACSGEALRSTESGAPKQRPAGV